MSASMRWNEAPAPASSANRDVFPALRWAEWATFGPSRICQFLDCMNAQTHTSRNPLVRMGTAILHWFDTSQANVDHDHAAADRIDWVRTLPFVLMHAACLFVFVVGV